MTKYKPPTTEQIEKLSALYAGHSPSDGSVDPRIEKLAEELIGQVADKWTLLILEILTEQSPLRFTEVGRRVSGISQKMLTQTLRQMERDGLVARKVYPVVPPKVEYSITDLGLTLSAAFCGVWVWAAENLLKVENARQKFDRRAKA